MGTSNVNDGEEIPVHIVQINLIDIKSFKTIVTGTFNVLWVAADIELSV